jgi:mono/diheme cytochrome c family protein
MSADRASRQFVAGAGALVAACAAATGLLLSGWTPGPGSPRAAPRAAAPPAARAIPVTRRTPRPARRAPETDRGRALALFDNECGSCHTLAAAGTTGRAGPNLDRLRPTWLHVLTAIQDGGRGSGLMTPNLLTGVDAALVARFVADSARKPR